MRGQGLHPLTPSMNLCSLEPPSGPLPTAPALFITLIWSQAVRGGGGATTKCRSEEKSRVALSGSIRLGDEKSHHEISSDRKGGRVPVSILSLKFFCTAFLALYR